MNIKPKDIRIVLVRDIIVIDLCTMKFIPTFMMLFKEKSRLKQEIGEGKRN